MELKEFVAQTLTQIVEGIKKAQKNIEGTSALIHPVADGSHDRWTHPIDFDVAVTVTEESGSEAKIGVFSNIIGAGVKGKSSISDKTISRIQFQIPVKYPHTQVEK